MKRISWGCVRIGTLSIMLSFIGIFIPLDEFKGFNLPFRILIISLQCGSIPFPKPISGSFIDILTLPIFDYFFSIILIASGIGTLWIKPWGRILGYIYTMSIIFISGIRLPITLIGYIKEFVTIEKYGFFRGLVWGGSNLYFYSYR